MSGAPAWLVAAACLCVAECACRFYADRVKDSWFHAQGWVFGCAAFGCLWKALWIVNGWSQQ